MKKHSIDTPYRVGIVHLYEFELNGDLVLFDTGPPTKEAVEYWRKNIDLARLKYLFITHCHPDHYGLTKFFEDESDAKIVLPRNDTVKRVRMPEYLKQMRGMFLEFGFPLASTDQGEEMLEAFQNSIPFPKDYLLLEDSADLLEKYGISYMSCAGHSQTDIVYLVENYAITGDVILREIFTAPLLDIDADSFDRRFKNYAAYCGTISKLKSIEEREFLPSHRDYIDSVDERIIFFIEKLFSRSETVAPLIKSGKSIYEIVMSLPGSENINHFRTYIKTSEVSFINDFLSEPELLIEALQENSLYDRVKDKIEPLLEKV